uniref:ATP synthase subunit b n=1 Tax=Strigamia maritima TaxID=126957 RepID=T1JNC6_STRMM
MLARLAIQSAISPQNLFRPSACAVRFCQNEAKEYKLEVLKIKEGPERDLVNFPRYKRPEYPGKVRFGFIPDEWFKFFYNKTGVTGPYVFGTGFLTYLFSKEIWVMEHEFYTGVSLLIMVVFSIKKFGPAVSKFLSDQVDADEKVYTDIREDTVGALKKGITDEQRSQEEAKGMKVLFDAKRENVMLQLEAAFRDRQMIVYNEVKKRLDYQVEKLNAQRRIEHKHMVSWIISNVVKSITAQQEKEALQKCIVELKMLSTKARA